MREVHYHDWLSNPVMMKKHDGSWRMCVDFTDLNKACPQDCYPLPEIDWKVESLCGYPFKCFLDAYKGYHQMQMAESDEEKIAFHTSQGVYCYTKMPFGLKNAGATYQRLVDKAFNSQVGRNIEVYVDDLVIKSYTEAEMLRDVDETFSEKSLALFKYFKRYIKKSDFHWTLEAEQAFKQLKQHLSELPLLVAPKPKEELIIYLYASYEAVSADFLVKKPDETPPDTSVVETPQEPWTLFTDRSSCVDGLGRWPDIWDKPGGNRVLPTRYWSNLPPISLMQEIVSDNGKQFSDNPFKDWCEKLNIIQRFASVKHPWSNGLVERANRSLGEGIKARLGEGNKNWIEELPYVLWAHLDVVHNNKELRLNLDLLEERCERAAIRDANAKLKMSKYYNARVCGVAFRPEDFVYRSNEASHAMDGGKLGPKWEGPYEVTKALGDGAYRLRSLEGTVLPRTWNIANLKKCYL
ncbi:reverse transcriptase domain-containing protein [Tanacetum coccineum]